MASLLLMPNSFFGPKGPPCHRNGIQETQMDDQKLTRNEWLRIMLDGRKRNLEEQIYRDAFDKLGRDYRAEYKEGMDSADWAVIQSTQSLGVKLLDIRESELSQLEKARSKLEEGTYGICEECGEEISERRLAAVFHAIHCIKCAEQSEQRN
jgi:DnaK suppressor protein